MTAKTTKAAAPKIETKTEVATVATETSKTVSNATQSVSNLFGACFSAGRKTIEGMIEVDKALYGYAKDAVGSYATLSKETMKAKSINDVIDLHVASAHARVEANAANTREVIEMTREKIQDAYAPVKEVIDTYRTGNAA